MISFGPPPVEGWQIPNSTQTSSISVDTSKIKNVVDPNDPSGGMDDTIPATARKFAVLFQEGEPEVEGYLLKYMGDEEIMVARPESCGEGIVAPSHKDIFVVTWEKTDLRWTIPNIRSREDEFAVVRFPGSGDLSRRLSSHQIRVSLGL